LTDDYSSSNVQPNDKHAGEARPRIENGEPASELVEHFFRHESANLIAVLSRAFGVRHIDLIEDTVQTAMLEAMHAWKQKGLPNNPAGWIHRVARNRVLDALRRNQVHQRAISHAGQTPEATESLVDRWLEDDQLPDSLLRMIFVCCHPSLDRTSQIALTLKILGGFGVGEIARGLLMKPETAKKKIQRAKQKLAAERIEVELPSPNELSERLSVVHDTLYLMFNEGYSTSNGHDPICDDLCEEAARLCHLLCQNKIGTSTTKALLALMLYHASRLESRVDDDGSAILLEDQDRSTWNHRLLHEANHWFTVAGEPISRFHLEAAIAMLHCQAASVATTNWSTIVGLYDRLLANVDSPVYRLNRAVAVAQVGKHDEAMAALDELRAEKLLANYCLLDCARARVYELQGNREAAINCYLEAISRGVAEHERKLIEKKIAGLGTRESDGAR